ncbi:DUF3486 family protein [Thiothrix lacustris]|uniref:DUF3486 family protein n=1 Tax=Thiothrix lacustris TaxID=525917 RepID=UPI000491E5C8|nr:DUF3486 family protein [Thiothrix lacustris]
MARTSAIDTLPPEVKAWLDNALLATNFRGYEAFAAELQERGCTVSRSSVHRYGQKLERRLSAIRASTEAAKMLAANVDDTENHLSGSVISLVQSELFETLLNLQEADIEDDPAERMKLLSNAARSISEVSRASIANKKWQGEVLAKAQVAAEKIDAIGKKGGLSAELGEEIRRVVLGMAE